MDKGDKVHKSVKYTFFMVNEAIIDVDMKVQ